jgi:membrane-bound lytic murein transglycosylase B
MMHFAAHHRLKIILSAFIGASVSACATDVSLNDKPLSESSYTASPSPSLPAPKEKNTATHSVISFDAWLQTLIAEAERKGISKQSIQLARPYLNINEKIRDFDQQQPEFTQTFWTYLDKRTSELRVQAGRLQQFTHHTLLTKIEQDYGVPSEILVSFWGLETNYGTYLGDFSTLEALTTLAYDPRRSDFFRKELLAALQIIELGNVTAKEMRGSWAGAIGQMQFMPTVYLKHATDADGDNKVNLWRSTPDALASAARYLKSAGWVSHQPWLQEVTLPDHFDYALADGKNEFSTTQLQKMGILPRSGSWLSSDSGMVTLLLPAGYEGPAFATWSNFKVIKRWNNSNNYALSVGILAHRLANNTEPKLNIPKQIRPWSRQFIVQLQETLTRAGFSTEGTDGWFGARSIQALRNFQKVNNLPADGYPNAKTLELLNLTP